MLREELVLRLHLGIGIGQLLADFGLQLRFQLADHGIEILLLLTAHRFAGEFRAVEIGIAGDPPKAPQQLRQGFSHLDLVDAGGGDFALHPHQTGLAVLRHAQVVLGQNGDDVARLQFEVMLRIAFVHRTPEVEGNEFRGEGVAIQPLDHGVFPVDLVEQLAHTELDIGCTGLFRQHEPVLALVIVGRDQGFAVRDQVAHTHAGTVGIAQRLGDVAAQRHRIGKLWTDFEQGQDVAVPQRVLEARSVKRKILDAARGGSRRIDALQQGLAGLGQHRQAAAECKDSTHRVGTLQFIDRRPLECAQHRHARADRRDHDDIAGQQRGITAAIAARNEIIKVQGADDATVALQLDVAHGARTARPAHFEQGIDQRRKAGNRVGPRLQGVTHDIDLDAAQASWRGIEFEVLEHAPDLAAQDGLQIARANAREIDCPDLGEVDLAVSIDYETLSGLDAAPYLESDFVSRAEHVVIGSRRLHDRNIACRCTEQLLSIDGQHAARGPLHETLEVAGLGFHPRSLDAWGQRIFRGWLV